jgi:hypothetical protein
VSEKLLHGADVVVVLEKVRRERVAERVRAGPLGDASLEDRLLDDAL